MDFYHYTNKTGKNAIVDSGVIKQSDGFGDARFGYGVYMTSLSPEVGKKMIAINNWDDNRTKISRKMLSKAAWAFKVTIPIEDMTQADSSRDIYIYPGDLILDNYEWEVIKV